MSQGITGLGQRTMQRWAELPSKPGSPLPTAPQKQATCQSLVRSQVRLDRKWANDPSPLSDAEAPWSRRSYHCPSSGFGHNRATSALHVRPQTLSHDRRNKRDDADSLAPLWTCPVNGNHLDVAEDVQSSAMRTGQLGGRVRFTRSTTVQG